jgi:hypothetical protein
MKHHFLYQSPFKVGTYGVLGTFRPNMTLIATAYDWQRL